MLRQRPPKPYKLLNFFMISVILLKWVNVRDFHLSFFQMVAEWRDFTVVTKLTKNFKSLYGFGGRCFNIIDVCMDFEPCFKVYNLVSIRPKSMKLGQMISLNAIFHIMGSVYRLVTIRNSPQFPVEFRNGLLFTIISYSFFSPWLAMFRLLPQCWAAGPSLSLFATSLPVKFLLILLLS